MFKYEEFIKKNSTLFSLNICNDSFDQQEIMNAVKIAAENEFSMISAQEKYIDSIWQWSEKTNLKISGVINNSENKLSDEEIFKSIKSISEKGIERIEYIIPAEIDILHIKNVVEAVKNIIPKKCDFFISFDFDSDKSILEFENFFKEILEIKRINGIKTATGLKKEYCDYKIFNTIFDILKNDKRTDFKIDALTDIYAEDKFIQNENILRLAKIILGEKWIVKNLFLSIDFDLIRKKIILLNKDIIEN